MKESAVTEIHPDDRFDVLVIGAGPAGYVAAGRAGRLGLRTALVEKNELGGVCLNSGCIPAKALMHGAKVARTIRSAEQNGVVPSYRSQPTIDVATLVNHSRRTAQQLTSGVEALMKAAKVTVLKGTATIVDKGEVSVQLNEDEVRRGPATRRLSAEHIIVATGASPRILADRSIAEPDGEVIWTYREALVPQEVPESLTVIGSGAVGSEFASLYADLGSKVTLLEAQDQVLPRESPDAAAVLERSFAQRGVNISTGITVNAVDVAEDRSGATVTYTDAAGGIQTVSSQRVLLSVGVYPNSAGLGLEQFGVVDDQGFIASDDHGKTAVWGLYAVGDVAGGPCLAHKASTEALRCVDALAGVDRTPAERNWKSWVPKCTYTTPEVASIGLSTEEAESLGHRVVHRPVQLRENGRALGAGETEGFGTVLLDADTHEILGSTLVGEGVTELVGSVAVAHAAGATAEDFVRAIIPHPSKLEMLHESVMAGLGRPVNTL